MEIPLLIEPLAEGRFRARTGEPLAASVEADSADEARRQLELLLRQRLQNGSQLGQTLREAIAENRRQEDGATP
jgi:hypothetical protein